MASYTRPPSPRPPQLGARARQSRRAPQYRKTERDRHARVVLARYRFLRTWYGRSRDEQRSRVRIPATPSRPAGPEAGAAPESGRPGCRAATVVETRWAAARVTAESAFRLGFAAR